MDVRGEVRQAAIDGRLSDREAARRFGIDRRTVEKMLSYSTPLGHRRANPVRRPKLEHFTGIIDAILDTDQAEPYKQRHTALQVFERFWNERGFRGGYTVPQQLHQWGVGRNDIYCKHSAQRFFNHQF